ncbi:MAG: diaminopimelate epimerase [Chthoniobacter sp.]|nr:diaminopimelate epimerase [Chthoniobacter sp.]
MNGAGNDFVMLDNRESALHLDSRAIAKICDRHRGVGADGVLVVEPARNGADFRMRYYNADGGEAEMCGNGARCFARFANRVAGMADGLSFETQAGVIRAEMLDDAVRITMSEPRELRLHEFIWETLTVHSVNTGVPHAVMFSEDIENVAVERVGAAIRYHEHFAPKGTNVNFIEQRNAQSIAIRTYERGVEGETLACGTGVVASAIILHELMGANAPIGVHVRGGERLEVSFEKSGGRYRNVTLTGPAEFVFDGEIEL